MNVNCGYVSKINLMYRDLSYVRSSSRENLDDYRVTAIVINGQRNSISAAADYRGDLGRFLQTVIRGFDATRSSRILQILRGDMRISKVRRTEL